MKKTTLAVIALITTSAALAFSQSILTTPPETAAQRAARESIVALQSIRSANLGMLRDAVGRAFPVDVDAQEVVTLWGANAALIFGLFDGHAQYLSTVMTAAGDTEGLAELAAIIGPVPTAEMRTVAEDGTVTIAPVAEGE
jgi:hypothetical protein